MKPYLGNTILTRKKKGFSNPYMEYLLASEGLKIIHTVNQQTNLFKEKELAKYLNNAKSGSFKQHIWGLYILSKWIEKNLI